MNDKRAMQPVTPVQASKNPPPPPPGKSERTVETASQPVVEVKRAAEVPPEAPAVVPPAPQPVVLIAGELTREQKLALFQAAFDAEKAVKEAEKAVDAAALVLSEKIKTLIAALGGSQGPWNVMNEVKLRARFRGELAYFLRDTDKAITI